MAKRLCRWFGCNAARIVWLSSNRVAISCDRCGATKEARRS